ncbi:MAG: hypothetical protein Q4D96_02865 [Propionibacteriaceae bacterium]|nr:hypothetical protein [Propionibacteriaceae bacterium]
MAALDRALDVLSAAAAPPPPGSWGWGRWDGAHVILEDDPDGTPLVAENATGRLVPGQRVYCRTGGKRAVIIGPEAPAPPPPAVLRGSNANGQWWRYPDGRQVCQVAYSGLASTDPYVSGHLAGSVWRFPMPFLAPPVVVCGRFQLATGASWPTSPTDITTTEVRLRGIDLVARAPGTPVHVQAQASGFYR